MYVITKKRDEKNGGRGGVRVREKGFSLQLNPYMNRVDGVCVMRQDVCTGLNGPTAPTPTLNLPPVVNLT